MSQAAHTWLQVTIFRRATCGRETRHECERESCYGHRTKPRRFSKCHTALQDPYYSLCMGGRRAGWSVRQAVGEGWRGNSGAQLMTLDASQPEVLVSGFGRRR